MPDLSSDSESSPTSQSAHPRHVSYIDKSRNYYAAVGYDQPYRWATNDDAPFAKLAKPLAESTVAVVTTSAPFGEDGAPALPKRSFAQLVSPVPAAMFTDDLSWDKDATHTNDVGSYLPLAALETLADSGRIGALAKRFYGVPTAYSQRKAIKDAERVLAWCREDDVDVVVLVPL